MIHPLRHRQAVTEGFTRRNRPCIICFHFFAVFIAFCWPLRRHYINGGPSLPPPLTPEQEKALLTRMMAGDAASTR